MGAPRLAAILTTGLLALAAAGCGGGNGAAPQVPGPPADVAIPESSQAPTAPKSDSSASPTATPDSTSTPDSSASGSTGTDTGTTAGGTASGGTTSPDTTADSPTNDTAPPAGSDAQQFEDFCAQNPGAC
jgi:hypothetical protein